MMKRKFGFGGPFANLLADWKGEGRAKRGDVKFLILELLAEKPRHGYDIIKELEDRHSGMYRPSAGSVYPTLQMLEEGGFLTSEQVEGKKVYTITDEGRQMLDTREPREAESEGGWEQIHDVRESAMKLAGAVMQAIRTGDPKTAGAAKKIIDQARRDIYALLAEES
jgi:DNA-binding PadR family transcriptional regulator